MTIKDQPIFLEFFNELANYIQKNHLELGCFYGYGSVFNPNRKSCSDLDGGIISSDIITDKEAIFDISNKMNELADAKRISSNKIQFNLLDKISCEDGRFLSYDITYTTFLKKYGKELFGANFLKNLNGIDNRFGVLESTAFNFRRVRNDFLMSGFYAGDSVKLFKKIKKSVALLKFLPQKIKELRIIADDYDKDYSGIIADEVYSKSRQDFLEELPEIISSIDLSFFEEIASIECKGLERLCLGVDEAIKFWGKVVGTHENIIKSYIENHPPRKIKVETLI